MSHDHLLRLSTNWIFFVLGCVTLGAAFIPVQWPSANVFLVAGLVALLLSMLLSRRAFTVDLMTRAPSGPVKLLRQFFAVGGAAAFLLAILGLALLFQQKPFGNGVRTYPASALAVFSLHPMACAYLVLAATGRKIRKVGRNGA
jgi:hypothetical protein